MEINRRSNKTPGAPDSECAKDLRLKARSRISPPPSMHIRVRARPTSVRARAHARVLSTFKWFRTPRSQVPVHVRARAKEGLAWSAPASEGRVLTGPRTRRAGPRTGPACVHKTQLVGHDMGRESSVADSPRTARETGLRREAWRGRVCRERQEALLFQSRWRFGRSPKDKR